MNRICLKICIKRNEYELKACAIFCLSIALVLIKSLSQSKESKAYTALFKRDFTP